MGGRILRFRYTAYTTNKIMPAYDLHNGIGLSLYLFVSHNHASLVKYVLINKNVRRLVVGKRGWFSFLPTRQIKTASQKH